MAWITVNWYSLGFNIIDISTEDEVALDAWVHDPSSSYV